MFLANKVSGETSLQTLERVRREEGIDEVVPMTYAGTLDPMAEGILLILVGDECKEKDKFSGTDKEYEVDVLFGIRTDSDDILGLIEEGGGDFYKGDKTQIPSINRRNCEKIVLKHQGKPTTTIDRSGCEKVLLKMVGRKRQKYHSFSHKKVNGVPLFELAKSGKVAEGDLPENEIEIYSIDILGWNKISGSDLKENIFNRIEKLEGDFRQEEILDGWRKFFENTGRKNFEVLKIRVKCSSGTYMRNLVRDIKWPALALKINRTQIDNSAV